MTVEKHYKAFLTKNCLNLVLRLLRLFLNSYFDSSFDLVNEMKNKKDMSINLALKSKI